LTNGRQTTAFTAAPNLGCSLGASQSYHLTDENDPTSVEEAFYSIEWFADYVEAGQDPSEPISDLLYPIFENAADQVEIFDSQGNRMDEDGNIVAMMIVSIYWRDLIEAVCILGTYSI
jgi:hypothetical protein